MTHKNNDSKILLTSINKQIKMNLINIRGYAFYSGFGCRGGVFLLLISSLSKFIFSVLVLDIKNFSCSCSVLVREQEHVREHVPEQNACSFIPGLERYRTVFQYS